MFNVNESPRTASIGLWISHYLFGVVAAVIALDSFNTVIGLASSSGSAGQVMIEDLLLGCISFAFGIASYLLHPLSAGVARTAWIFPLCLFALALCWDLHDGLTWQVVVSEYIVFLPGNTLSAEPWDGYFMFSFPVLAAVSYALGNRVCEARIFKAHPPDSMPVG